MKIVSSFIPPSHNPQRPLNTNANNEKRNKTDAPGSNRHVSSDEFAHVAEQKSQKNNPNYHGRESIEPDTSLSRNSVTLTSLTAAEKQLIVELRTRDSDSRIREQKHRMDLGLRAYAKQEADKPDPPPHKSDTIEQFNNELDLDQTSSDNKIHDTIQFIQAGQQEEASFKPFDNASLKDTQNLPIGLRKMLEVQEIGANGELIKSGARLDIFI